MGLNYRYPLYPATDEALVSTLALFGVDMLAKRGPTDEERKIAEGFDVGKALNKAKQERSNMKPHYTFFYQNRTPFSNWYPSKFTVGDITFSRGEQFMMYMKAIVFDDFEIAAKILATDNPKTQKDLGRGVRNFVEEEWVELREDIMVHGLYEKFNQNPKLKQALLDTGDTIMVEASPTDTIWGIGMAVDNPHIEDESKWRGQNLLGKVLMRVRDRIRENDKRLNFKG